MKLDSENPINFDDCEISDEEEIDSKENNL